MDSVLLAMNLAQIIVNAVVRPRQSLFDSSFPCLIFKGSHHWKCYPLSVLSYKCEFVHPTHSLS